MEALLSICSPHEAATLIVVAINRLIQPCPPANLSTWLAETSIPSLFSCPSLDTEEIHHILQKVSDQPVAGMFTRMFSRINGLSDEPILMTMQGPSSSHSFIRQTSGITADMPVISGHFPRLSGEILSGGIFCTMSGKSRLTGYFFIGI